MFHIDDENDLSVSATNVDPELEDGLSLASSQLPGTNGDEKNAYSGKGSSSVATPIISNFDNKKTLDFFDDGSDDEDEIERSRLTPVNEDNAKIDDEFAKLEEQVNAEYKTNTRALYDLSVKLPSPSSTKDDDHTSDTQHRSGSSAYILHTWMKRKEWESVRQFLKHPPKEHEKLMSSIHYANDDGETPLHIACRKNAPVDIITMITKIGGKKTVRAVNKYGQSNPLHHACHFNLAPEAIQHLIRVGGESACRSKDDIGNTALHWALSKRRPYFIIKELIEVGGFDTIHMANKIEWTALHTACYFDANTDVIAYLISVAGSQAVKKMDRKHRTPIDLILDKNPLSVDSVITLLHALGEIDQVSLNLPQHTINGILEWVRRQPCSDALECRLVQRILNETFVSRKYLTVWMLDLYFQIILVSIFSFGIDDALSGYGIPVSGNPAIGLYLSISWLLGREAIQFITTPFNEFAKDLKNWVDVSQIILVFLSLDKLVFRGGVFSSSDVTIITITAGLVWFNLLSVLGKAFYRIRVYIVYLQMVRKFLCFLSSHVYNWMITC